MRISSAACQQGCFNNWEVQGVQCRALNLGCVMLANLWRLGVTAAVGGSIFLAITFVLAYLVDLFLHAAGRGSSIEGAVFAFLVGLVLTIQVFEWRRKHTHRL
jgi:hypothetical protein